MPELPEVETFARALAAGYGGKVIAGISFHRADLRFPLEQEKLRAIFAPGTVLRQVTRIGKQLVLTTNRGRVHIGLGMTGAFLPTRPKQPHKHEHITLCFAHGECIAFVDPRRFGFWKVAAAADRAAATADPLDPKALEVLLHACRRLKRSVKSLLLDQNRIAGVGNIYALEALHRAGIRPMRRCSSLLSRQRHALARALPEILQEAITAGGSTIASYRRLSGEEGKFQMLHRVYDRNGKPCLKRNCTGTIVRVKQGGRSSWYCPRCQK